MISKKQFYYKSKIDDKTYENKNIENRRKKRKELSNFNLANAFFQHLSEAFLTRTILFLKQFDRYKVCHGFSLTVQDDHF